MASVHVSAEAMAIINCLRKPGQSVSGVIIEYMGPVAGGSDGRK
jgi:hypothetical protein